MSPFSPLLLCPPFAATVVVVAPLPLDLAAAIAARLDQVLVHGPSPVSNWAGLGQAPARPPTYLPYVSVSEPDEDSYPLGTDGTRVAQGTIQLLAFHSEKALARRLGDLAAEAIGSAPIRFAAGKLMVLSEGPRGTEKDPDPAPGGGDCWTERRLLRFRYSFQSRLTNRQST